MSAVERRLKPELTERSGSIRELRVSIRPAVQRRRGGISR
jgi:hypothetical protein